jgi:phosphoribosylformylglycinamidine synthase
VRQVEDGNPPKLDLEMAPRTFQKLHEAIVRGYIRSCHDLSEGGLAAALAEMCLAGGWGARLEIAGIASGAESRMDDQVILFSESNTRFLIEVPKDRADDLGSLFSSIPWQAIGTVTDENVLRIFGRKAGEPIISVAVADLKEAWQKPLRW